MISLWLYWVLFFISGTLLYSEILSSVDLVKKDSGMALIKINSGMALIELFVVFLMPLVAVFWPNLRFILMARGSANSFTRFEEKPVALRIRETFRAIVTSAWWFVPALWLVSLRYQLLGMYINFMPLAVPLAVVAGWRSGVAAIIPVLVGSLPFVAEAHLLQHPAIVSPGGFWPAVVLPLLARLVGDEALRRRIFGRGWASPVDCAVLVLCLSAAVPKIALNSALAVSVDPSWFAATVGFLIGASRMRWREPTLAFVASLVLLGAVELNGWGWDLAPSVLLSVAAFFGGRVWRSLVVPETEGFRGISAASAIVLMLLAVIVASWPEIPHAYPFLSLKRCPATLRCCYCLW
jgi:hypothetical protein